MLGKLNTYYFDQFLKPSFEVKPEYQGEHEQIRTDFLAMIDAINGEQRERIETCKKVLRGEPIVDEEEKQESEENMLD